MRGGCDAARRKEALVRKCEDEGESRVGWLFIGVQIGLHVFSVPTMDSILIQDERGNCVEASNLLRKTVKVNDSCISFYQPNQSSPPFTTLPSQDSQYSPLIQYIGLPVANNQLVALLYPASLTRQKEHSVA